MTPRNEREGNEKFNYPKILGDVYEAIMGAILLDSNWDLTQMWNVCAPDLELSEHDLMVLQHNLDKIKEIEQNKANANIEKHFFDQVCSKPEKREESKQEVQAKPEDSKLENMESAKPVENPV